MSARQAGRDVVARAARTRGFGKLVTLLERMDRRREGLLTVLMYHRVDSPDARPDLDPSLISATPAEFEIQIAYVARHCAVLSLADLLAVRRGERRLPPRAVLITFDDAYRDFATSAWPVLKRHALPVTLFVPTGLPDRPERGFWWDRLHHALESSAPGVSLDTPAGRLPLSSPRERTRARSVLRDWIRAAPHDEAMATVDSICRRLAAPPPAAAVLGWDELRRLAAEGVELAPHSRTHPLLNRLPLERARDEVRGSVRDLEREVGRAAPAFAFPGGGHSEALVRWLPQAGIEVAFTVVRGGNDLRHADWTALRRVNVGRRSSVPLLRVQMLSWRSRPRRPYAAEGAA